MLMHVTKHDFQYTYSLYVCIYLEPDIRGIVHIYEVAKPPLPQTPTSPAQRQIELNAYILLGGYATIKAHPNPAPYHSVTGKGKSY